MSPYVLDTNTLTLYQAGHPTVLQRVQQCPPALARAIVARQFVWLWSSAPSNAHQHSWPSASSAWTSC